MVEVRERRRKPNPPENPFADWKPVKVVGGIGDKIMGIDASLTNTGVAVLVAGVMRTYSLEPKKLRGAERLAWFRDKLIEELRAYAPVLVAIEGYAFGAKMQREAMGELGGVIRMTLHDLAVPFLVIPPTSLKLFITGKGAGPKDNMSKEIYKRYGVDLSDNNQVDAAGLAIMALATRHALPLTEFQQRALGKVEQ